MRPDHGAEGFRGPIIERVEESGARYGYEPGCFRPPTGREGDAGLLGAVRALGLELEVVDERSGDAPGALALNGLPAYARVARILSLAARLGRGALPRRPPTIVSPCTACFRNLSRARKALATHTDLRRQVDACLAEEGFRCEPGAVRVRHLLDVLWEDVGPDAIRARVSRPLSGRRVAAYYGCLAVRGGDGAGKSRSAGFETRFERLLDALGADVVELPSGRTAAGAAPPRRARRSPPRSSPGPAVRRRAAGRRDRRCLPPLPAQSSGPEPQRSPRAPPKRPGSRSATSRS
jgi:Heterodisulfide reductase, subunit B